MFDILSKIYGTSKPITSLSIRKNIPKAKDNKYYYSKKKQVNIQHGEYNKSKYHSDEHFRLKTIYRVTLRQYVLGINNSPKMRILTGQTKAGLRKYLEHKFQRGMNWKNYGDWEIDHIVPVSQFNLTRESDARKAYHYTNLKPVWKVHNRAKHQWR